MSVLTEKIAAKLKEIIDKSGPFYVTNEPYQVYKELLESKAAERKTAGALLHALVNGVQCEAEKNCDIQTLSMVIKRDCSLNKAMADRIAEIFFYLYSSSNKGSWKKKNKEGLAPFLNEEFSITWEGFSVWDAGEGTVDCHFEADIVLMPTETAAKEDGVRRLLDENPFTTKDDIGEYYKKDLREYLDSEFEKYCTEDDYYQPVVEDFEIDYHVSEWSKIHGFEVVSCEGDGDDNGYESKFRNGWH